MYIKRIVNLPFTVYQSRFNEHNFMVVIVMTQSQMQLIFRVFIRL